LGGYKNSYLKKQFITFNQDADSIVTMKLVSHDWDHVDLAAGAWEPKYDIRSNFNGWKLTIVRNENHQYKTSAIFKITIREIDSVGEVVAIDVLQYTPSHSNLDYIPKNNFMTTGSFKKISKPSSPTFDYVEKDQSIGYKWEIKNIINIDGKKWESPSEELGQLASNLRNILTQNSLVGNFCVTKTKTIPNKPVTSTACIDYLKVNSSSRYIGNKNIFFNPEFMELLRSLYLQLPDVTHFIFNGTTVSREDSSEYFHFSVLSAETEDDLKNAKELLAPLGVKYQNENVDVLMYLNN
jgi:hypothetical protein